MSHERSSYARFWRCALQVNPAAYSEAYRGSSHGLTEEAYNLALLDQCQALGIRVVGVADHGNVGSVERLRACLEPHGIVVFPGFEIASSEKVHMVCLFREDTSTEALNRYLGALDLTDPKARTPPSRLGALELSRRILELDGFWYAAHVEGKNGLLRLQGDGGGLTHIWTQCDPLVAQVGGRPEDLGEGHRAILDNTDPAYRRERPVVLVHAKDVAKPEDLAHPLASCWIKMTAPTFDAFRIAFLDPESRVRLNAELDESHGSIRHIQIDGGYLDEASVELSPHLNTIVGGRGTGKSTLIECLRYAFDRSPKAKQAQRLHHEIVRENLGRSSGSIRVELKSADQHGRGFSITRRYGEPPIVRSAGGAVSNLLPRDLLPSIEFYGQNEIYELAQDRDSRLKLLERFLPEDGQTAERHGELRRALGANRQRLVKARIDLDEAEQQIATLPKLQEQLQGFHELGIQAKLARLPLFERERQLVERVNEELDRVARGCDSLEELSPDLAFLGDKALENLPHAQHLAAMRGALEGLARTLQHHLAELRRAMGDARSDLEPHLDAWQSALRAGEQEVDIALSQLPNMSGKSGREVGTAYKQLTQEIERIRPLDGRIATLRELRSTLDRERSDLVAELSELRGQRAAAAQRAMRKLNQRLEGKLRIELRPESDRSPLRSFLLDSQLDGVGERRLAWVDECDQMTPLALAKAIEEGPQQLRQQWKLTPGMAEALCKLPVERLLELAELELQDHVEIALNVAHQGPPSFRPLSQLSTGQQCTAVLHLLLLDNPDPLIIDQPEDNLDNAFIAERIVHELRRVKTERQFLFSTHNANIPVFGDAEWIGILTASEAQGAIPLEQQGSIDVPAIRNQVAEVLEGGRAAFLQRKEKYGF